MELNELKESWKVYSGKQEESLVLSASRIEALLQERTREVKSKLGRVMGWDAILMLIINSGFIGLVYLLDLQLKHLSSLVILGVTFLLFVHYHIKRLSLQQSARDESVQEGLNRTISSLKGYTRTYQIFTPLVFGLLTFTGLQLGIFSAVGIFEEPANILAKLAITVFTALFSWIVVRIIISRTINPHISRLEAIRSEWDDLSVNHAIK